MKGSNEPIDDIRRKLSIIDCIAYAYWKNMRITIVGELFRGTHITGPTHNYLGLRVSLGSQSDFEITVLPTANDCTHDDHLLPEEVKPWIEEGIRIANDELHSNYKIDYAEIVENDSRRPHVYEELARRIVTEAYKRRHL